MTTCMTLEDYRKDIKLLRTKPPQDRSNRYNKVWFDYVDQIERQGKGPADYAEFIFINRHKYIPRTSK